MAELIDHLELLADRWCESRKLEPLRLLLNGKASLNGLTDGWEECRLNLKSIRSGFSHELPEAEMDVLVAAIHIADAALDSNED